MKKSILTGIEGIKMPGSKTAKLILIWMMVVTALFDYLTFLFDSDFHIFEINPFFIATKSIIIVSIIKFGFISAVAWLIWKDKAHSDLKRYAIILITVYVIFAQVLGGWSNLKIHAENPSPQQALAPKEAVKTFSVLSLVFVYFPVILALLSFKFWQWCYPRSVSNGAG